MGHPPKNFLSFYNILACVKVDNTALGLEIYIQVLQTCLLLEGCRGQCAGTELELIAVGLCVQKSFHGEGWILGTQTQRTRATGVTPLQKRHHQTKMNLMSNIIKSNASDACCLLRVVFCVSLCASAI